MAENSVNSTNEVPRERNSEGDGFPRWVVGVGPPTITIVSCGVDDTVFPSPRRGPWLICEGRDDVPSDGT